MGVTISFRNNGGTPSLFSTLMILKSACENNQCYIDRLITIFMKVLTKMTHEHLKNQETTQATRATPATAVATAAAAAAAAVAVVQDTEKGKCDIIGLSSLSLSNYNSNQKTMHPMDRYL